MQLRIFILCILIGCLASHAFICKVRYQNLVECSKFSNEIYADSFSIFYSFGEIASKFFSSIFQYITLILIISFFGKISSIFIKDLVFILVIFTFYYYIGIITPLYYDTFYIEQKTSFNKYSNQEFFNIILKEYLFYLFLLEIIVKIINILFPIVNSEQPIDEGGNDMTEVNYATESEVIHTNDKKIIKNPWLFVFVIFVSLSLLIFTKNGSGQSSLQFYSTDSFTKYVNGTEILAIIDSKHTMHSRAFLKGYFNTNFAISDNLFKIMADDEIVALLYTIKGQYINYMHLFNFFLIISKAFFFALIFRTVFNIGCTSFGLNQYESSGRVLVISFSIFIPFVFLMSPFEMLLRRNLFLKGDCYATSQTKNVYKAILNLYKWNGHAIKNSQIYKMFLVDEPSLDDRLINIERCYAFNSKK